MSNRKSNKTPSSSNTTTKSGGLRNKMLITENDSLYMDGSDKVALIERKSPNASRKKPDGMLKNKISASGEKGEADDNDDDEAQVHHSNSSTNFWHDLRGDRANMFLLIFLYVLQGIPLGLAGSVSFILGSRHATYQEQAQFSLVFWPFSLKLIWAPIVDYVYSRRFGRRKSWLVPTQYLIGLFMVVLSGYTDSLVERPHATAAGDAEHATQPLKPPPLILLTCIFFMLNFLASVQDIAVDGWALTMLRRRNVGYASTANSVGQTAGYFIGNILFLALESPDFCNKFLRTTPQQFGIVTLSSFLFAWGIIFVFTTTLVALFKHENDDGYRHVVNAKKKRDSVSDAGESLMDAYKCLWKIIKLPSVQLVALIFLTSKVAFAASESVGALKLIEFGVPKEQLAFLGSLLVPLQIVLPIIISKRTNGPRPLDIYVKSYPYRVVIGIIFAAIIYYTPSFRQSDDSFPLHYYGILLTSYFFHQICVYCMFVASMAFSSRISDPSVGGTYMTLLNTLSNLGGVWPSTLFLWMVDKLTWTRCEYTKDDYTEGEKHAVTCDKRAERELCEKHNGGVCKTLIDGFYVECAIGVVLAVLWLWKIRKVVNRVSALPERAWKL